MLFLGQGPTFFEKIDLMIMLEETVVFIVTKILKENLNAELASVIAKLNKFYKTEGSERVASDIVVSENSFFEYSLEEKVIDETIRIIILPARKAIPGLKQTLSASEFRIEFFIAYDYSENESSRYIVPERIREAAIRTLKKGLLERGFRDYYLNDTGDADVINNKNNRTSVSHFEITFAG